MANQEEPKDLADICIWLSEFLEEHEQCKIHWRVIMKVINDFLSDNNLEIQIKIWKK